MLAGSVETEDVLGARLANKVAMTGAVGRRSICAKIRHARSGSRRLRGGGLGSRQGQRADERLL